MRPSRVEPSGDNRADLSKAGRRPRRLGPALVALLAVAAYLNALPNGFCYDGNVIVHRNAKVNEPGQWGTIWTTDYWSETGDATPNRDLLYRPIALSSYRLVRLLAGDRPFPQLLFNVLLHAVASVLIIRLCGHTGCGRGAPVLAGAIFAVLPIHTEVIDDIVGRGDLLAAVGTMVALLAHRRFALADDRPAIGWAVAAVVALFVAMGAKESGVASVALLVLYDAWWFSGTARANASDRWLSTRSVMRLAYVVVPTVVYFSLRYNALGGVLFQAPAVSKTVNVLVDAPLWQHGLGVFQLWGMYWAKMLWPDLLSVDYSINAIRLATSVVDAQFLLGVLVAGGLVVVSVVNWRRGRRSWAVLTAAMVVAYGPTANALVLIQVFFAERIWYLPSVWASMAVAMAIAPLLRRPMAYAVVGLVLFGMTARCWIRNGEWRDNASLYAAAYRDYPDAVGAQVHHAQMLVARGDYGGGIAVLRKTLSIDMGFTDAQRVITQAYLLAGDEASAMRHAQIAEMQVPGHRPTLEALAFLQQRAEGRSGDELAALRGMAEARPDDVAAELRVVVGLREFAMLDEAMARLASGKARFANDAAWHYEYAVTLVYANERSAAIDRYDRAIRLEPDHPPWLVERAMLLLERREGDDLDLAWALAQRASALAPEAAYVLVCQAELTANRGDLAAARELYRRAIESTPPGDERRRAFEQRVRILGG